MDLLVLGGTRFVGRALVMDGLQRGWNVTALNRGRSGQLPAEVELITADRTDPVALAATLEGRSFDLAVDTWATAPRVVQHAADLLIGKAGRVGYVSSMSVYDEGRPAGGDESWPVVHSRPDAEATDYAADKRGGELAALQAFPDALLARAGIIVGPWENVGRLPWWLNRFAQGGPVVAPGRPERQWQLVDARDLAAFLNTALAAGTAGVFDVTCPDGHATTRNVLEAVQHATGDKAELVWIDDDTLLAAEVEPWMQLPGWVPETDDYAGLMEADVSAALAAGLTCRAVEQTVEDTWQWLQADGEPGYGPRGNPFGLPPELEQALLAG